MNHLNKSLLSFAVLGTAALGTSSGMAQTFELGDQIQLDLRENRTPELRPNLSTDGNQLNLQIEEQPQPETRFRLGEDGFEIRQEQPAPQERLNLTVPIENQQ